MKTVKIMTFLLLAVFLINSSPVLACDKEQEIMVKNDLKIDVGIMLLHDRGRAAEGWKGFVKIDKQTTKKIKVPGSLKGKRYNATFGEWNNVLGSLNSIVWLEDPKCVHHITCQPQGEKVVCDIAQ